jgi:hypothetical protein
MPANVIADVTTDPASTDEYRKHANLVMAEGV